MVTASAGASGRRVRVGIVLGAGGILGAAWMVGVLGALQRRLDRPIGEVEVIVGTSAGSILAAALREGVTVAELVDHQRGGLTTLPSMHEIDRATAPVPPRLGLGSPQLLTLAALAPHRVRPRVAAFALVPPGRGKLHVLAEFVDTLAARRPGGRSRPPGWPTKQTWVVAVDYQTGQRVVFGQAGSPPAALSEAVVASCSIPGWYEPKTIGGKRYVDGGVYSVASVDLVATSRLDLVYVLVPLGGHERGGDPGLLAQGEWVLRRVVSGWVDIEAAKVRAGGARVVVVTPGSEDLDAMGRNLMDPSRRRRVLETALRTAPARLAALDGTSARER
jgi:NTE family protein